MRREALATPKGHKSFIIYTAPHQGGLPTSTSPSALVAHLNDKLSHGHDVGARLSAATGTRAGRHPALLSSTWLLARALADTVTDPTLR